MTAELVPYAPAEIEYVPRFVLDPVQAQELDQQLRQSMRAVLVEGHDYGRIPGAEKPSLWQPGAEKLLQWFGLGFTMERTGEIERDGDGQRLGVTYRCTVIKELPGRRITVAASDGYAGYDEPKFFKSLQTVQAETEAKERYWADRDGRQPNPAKWAYVMEYRAPWNTVIKMAQKRALVSAAKDATAAAALFTDDEDTPDASPAGPAETRPGTPPSTGQRSAPRSPRKGQRPAGEAPDPVRKIRDEFGRLGVGDSSDRAVLVASILRLDELPGSLAKLTPEQQQDVLNHLESSIDLDGLNGLISDGAAAQEEARA